MGLKDGICSDNHVRAMMGCTVTYGTGRIGKGLGWKGEQKFSTVRPWMTRQNLGEAPCFFSGKGQRPKPFWAEA